MNDDDRLKNAIKVQADIDAAIKNLNDTLDKAQRLGYEIKFSEKRRHEPTTSSGHLNVKAQIVLTLGGPK